jgi:hypothetical protein
MDNPSYPPPAEPPLTPAPTAPAASSRDWMAYTSLGLGIVNL